MECAPHSRSNLGTPRVTGREIRLPDGKQVTLTKPWGQYTVAELETLGLIPGMSLNGTDDTVSMFIPADR